MMIRWIGTVRKPDGVTPESDRRTASIGGEICSVVRLFHNLPRGEASGFSTAAPGCDPDFSTGFSLRKTPEKSHELQCVCA